MKYGVLLVPLLCSCAFFEAAVKPASVATAGAGGALLGGPAGAAVAAGGVSAAWDIAKAEGVAEDAVEREQALTMAVLQATVTGSVDPLRDLIDQKSSSTLWITIKIIALLVVVYIAKQVWGSKRNLRRLEEFGERLLEKAKDGN